MKRYKAIAAALLAGGLIAGGTATAASASVAGNGPPTPAPTDGGCCHHKAPPRVWQFDLQESQIGATSVNDVQGFGALAFTGWSVDDQTPNLSRFSNTTGDSVTLWHDSLDLASLSENFQTCTVTFDQPNGRFRLVAGTGIGANLRSVNGRFDLQGMVSFPYINKWQKWGGVQVCPLVFLSGDQIRWIIENGKGGPHFLPEPTFTDFSVQGESLLFRVRPIPFAPTASPTDS